MVPEVSSQTSEAEKQTYPAMMCMTHNNDWHGVILLRAHQWYTYVALHTGGRQKLFSWTYSPLNMKEIMSSTRNLANYLGLVKSWILEENQQPPLY